LTSLLIVVSIAVGGGKWQYGTMGSAILTSMLIVVSFGVSGGRWFPG
jgi:hypothetical protein